MSIKVRYDCVCGAHFMLSGPVRADRVCGACKRPLDLARNAVSEFAWVDRELRSAARNKNRDLK